MNKFLGNTVILHIDKNISLCFGRRICAAMVVEEGTPKKDKQLLCCERSRFRNINYSC